jgi:L-threonylcarbamoyladenylate synthase
MTLHESIQQAIKVVRDGGIIIYPTDTAFGIGCRIDNHTTVDRLFSIRKRPSTLAMPILVCSADMALTYFDMPSDIVRRLMKKYWPGALTIVSTCKKELIYSPIRADGETVGIRMPNHKTILEIIQEVGVPVLGSSANFHGEKTPYSLGDLDQELVKLVDYVVEGECAVGQASTVVDCSMDPYVIIRQGAIQISDI